MHEIKYISWFITSSYLHVSKKDRLNSTHYLIMKDFSKKELQNIAINHSADMDYNDFMKIYLLSCKN